MTSRAKDGAVRGFASRRPSVIIVTALFGAELCLASLPVSRELDAISRIARSVLILAPAYAGDDEHRMAEQMREEQKRQLERQMEEQRQQAERQAEAQRQQAERQAEEQRHQAEQEREQQKDQAERQRESQHDADTDATDGRHSREDRSDGDHKDDSTRRSRDRKHDDQEDDDPPKTVVEVWRRLTEGKKKKPGAQVPGGQPETDRNSFVDREIVATNLGRMSRERLKGLGFEVISSADLSNFGMRVERLRLPRGMDVATASQMLKTEVPSGAFSPNHIYRAYHSAEGARESYMPEKLIPGPRCDEGRCFGQNLIHWSPVLRTCARRVRVGVIDTSFDLTHPALVGHRFNSGTFVEGAASLHDDWHGTAVLSILAGDAKSGTPGLIPDAEFYLASVFRSDEHGNTQTSTVDLLKALAWLDAFDVRLVNMSFSGPSDDLLEAALARMRAKGVVFVAAAGNEGPGAPPSYPAAYPSVIAVTAVSRSLQGYRYANRGSYVDLAAPGVDIWTALPNAKQGYRSGTSFAAPFVTSIIAVMQQSGDLPHDKAALLKRFVLKDLGAPGRDPIYGEGLPISPSTCGPPPDVTARASRTRPASPLPAGGHVSWSATVLPD